MECSYIQKLLNAYADGTLDREHVLIVKRHIAHCPSCRGSLSQLKPRKFILILFLVIAIVGVSIFFCFISKRA